MCTVSIVYLPKGEIVITQNRDESKSREIALKPTWNSFQDKLWLMPIDVLSNGTWMITSKSEKRVYCLFNGGLHKHTYAPPYSHSRGLIIKELIAYSNAENYFSIKDLKGIEPFSLLAFENKICTLFRFDSENLSQELISGNQIFSSSTLYDKDIQDLRNNYFLNSLNSLDSWAKIIDFHQSHYSDSMEEGFLINRNKIYTQNLFSVLLDSQGGFLDFIYKEFNYA